MSLRVVTTNVQNTEGPPARQQLVKTVLRRLEPDVVALQEVASPRERLPAAVDELLRLDPGGVASSDRDDNRHLSFAPGPHHCLLYGVTQTAGSAARLYYDGISTGDLGRKDRVEVPTAVAIFPKDLVPAPRAFAERWFDVRRWTEMPRGGHFAAWEEPELLAADLRAFFLDPLMR